MEFSVILFVCFASLNLFLFILERFQIYKIVVEIQNNPHLPGPLGLGTVVILLWQSLVESHSLHYRLFRNALASVHSHHWYPHTNCYKQKMSTDITQGLW